MSLTSISRELDAAQPLFNATVAFFIPKEHLIAHNRGSSQTVFR
jgi:hypothetical protein